MTTVKIPRKDWTVSTFSDDEEDTQGDFQTARETSEDSEDDVPLAQRIPGALRAQKSIRVKEKAKKELHRRETQSKAQSSRPSVDAESKPFEADALTRKLTQLNVTSRTSNVSTTPPDNAQAARARVRQRAYSNVQETQRPIRSPVGQQDSFDFSAARKESLSRQGSLSSRYAKQSVRSISRPSSPSQQQVPPMPPIPSSKLYPMQAPSQAEKLNVQLLPSRTSVDGNRPSIASEVPSRAPQASIAPSRQRAMTLQSSTTPRKLHRSQTSADRSAHGLPSKPIGEFGEVPPTGDTLQQRVFIGDLQRFNTVEIGPRTTAGGIVKLVEAQGELNCPAAYQPGGWMLWELANEYGMERPLRDFELPAEVYASWNSNARVNAFIIKKTPLAPLLSRTALPSSSPTFSGFVQWEIKRGKWTKRWMELREHSLWLSKRETGKDSTFLCSLSNFDCYYVSHLHKAPKPFVFAVKSTDNITFFENPADYLHTFSCDNALGAQWVERIMLARSYVLSKERTVLFGASPPTQQPMPQAGTSSRTRDKVGTRSTGPLIQHPTGPPAVVLPNKNVFQSGSLLAKVST